MWGNDARHRTPRVTGPSAGPSVQVKLTVGSLSSPIDRYCLAVWYPSTKVRAGRCFAEMEPGLESSIIRRRATDTALCLELHGRGDLPNTRERADARLEQLLPFGTKGATWDLAHLDGLDVAGVRGRTLIVRRRAQRSSPGPALSAFAADQCGPMK